MDLKTSYKADSTSISVLTHLLSTKIKAHDDEEEEDFDDDEEEEDLIDYSEAIPDEINDGPKLNITLEKKPKNDSQEC